MTAQKQLEQYVFFVDRSSGGNILPDELQKLGLNIERHDDHFSQNAIDPEWIQFCGQRGWIIVSGDKAIKKNFLEKQAIMSAGVAAFFFTSNDIKAVKQAEAFAVALPRIAKFIINQEKPFIARIHPDGKLELWINHKGEDCLQKKLERRKQKRK